MLRPAQSATFAVVKQVSLHLGGGGACTKASHHCQQVLRVDLSITAAVVETETLLVRWLDTHRYFKSLGFSRTD